MYALILLHCMVNGFDIVDQSNLYKECTTIIKSYHKTKNECEKASPSLYANREQRLKDRIIITNAKAPYACIKIEGEVMKKDVYILENKINGTR